MIVSMYMTSGVLHVAPDDDAGAAVGIMAKHGVRCVPVLDAGRLVGILSRSDVLHCSRGGTNPFAPEALAETDHGFSIRDAMSTKVATVPADAPIETAAEILDQRRLSTLVVTGQGGAVLGILSRTDILRAFREIVFSPDATRFTLVTEEGVDIAASALGELHARGLELRAYAEHRHDERRYILVGLHGDDHAIDAWLAGAWSQGVRVFQVQRPLAT